MAYSGRFDWSSFLNKAPSQEEQTKSALELLKGQLEMQGEYGYQDRQLHEGLDGIVEALANDKNFNPNYKITEKDMEAVRAGGTTPNIEAAKIQKRLAELYNIPLEEYDPNSPFLDPTFANNKWDARRQSEDFLKDLPEEYRITKDPSKENLLEKLFGPGAFGGTKALYDLSSKKATEAMYKAGMSGEEIEQLMKQNQLTYSDNPRGIMGQHKDNLSELWSGYKGATKKLQNTVEGTIDNVRGKNQNQGADFVDYHQQRAKPDLSGSTFESQYPDIAKIFQRALQK